MKIKYYILPVLVLLAAVFLSWIIPQERTVYFDGLEEISDETEYFSLPSGEFSITFSYISDTENRAEIYLPQMEVLELPSTGGTEGSRTYEFSLKRELDNGMVRFAVPQGEDFSLKEIRIDAGDFITRDVLVPYFLIAVMIASALLFIGKMKSGKPFGREEIFTFAALSVIFVISSAPWIFSSEIFRGSDTRDHLQRIEGMMYGLEAGQFPVIVYPNWCNNFGELGILYPNSFLVIPALLRRAGLSMPVVYRLFMASICLIQTVFIYISSKVILKDRRASLIASAIYCLTPYLLYNMYQKGTAAGKSMAAAFIPLLFAGIYSIVRDEGTKKKWYFIPIAFLGIFQSHVVSTFFTACFILLIGLSLFRELFLKRENLIALLKAFVLTILLNIGFFISFLYYYFSDWDRSRLEWRDFFAGLLDWDKLRGDGISFFLPVLAVVAIVLLFSGFIRFEDKLEKRLFVAFAIVGIVFYWLQTPLFPWKLLCEITAVKTLTNLIQAPHRFILYCSAPAAFWIGKAFLPGITADGRKKLIRFAAGALAVAAVFYGIFIQFEEYYGKKLLLKGIFGNIYTRVSMDYLPSGTTEEDFHSDTGRVSDESRIVSIYYEKENAVCTYLYSCDYEGEYAEFPLLYYEGYEAYNADGERLEVFKGNGSHVRVYLEKGENKVISVSFRTKKIFTLSYIFSILVGFIFAVFIIRKGQAR